MRTIHQKAGETREHYVKKAARFCRRRFVWHRTEGEHQHHHRSFAVAAALKDAEKVYIDLGTFGEEGDTAQNGEGHITIQYLNTGDSYALTVCYWRGRFVVSSWGDIVERVIR